MNEENEEKTRNSDGLLALRWRFSPRWHHEYVRRGLVGGILLGGLGILRCSPAGA